MVKCLWFADEKPIFSPKHVLHFTYVFEKRVKKYTRVSAVCMFRARHSFFNSVDMDYFKNKNFHLFGLKKNSPASVPGNDDNFFLVQ